MKNQYKGHEIEWLETEDKVRIDGVDYTREYYNTDLDDGIAFGRGWLDAEFEEIVRVGLESAYGSEARINSVIEAKGFLFKMLSEKEQKDFGGWHRNSSSDELLRAMLELWFSKGGARTVSL